MKNEKRHHTIQEQVQLLLARGLEGDPDLMASRLAVVNYYRLSGYWFPMQIGASYPEIIGATPETFRPGSTFENVWRRYTFDRELRLLVLDAIERFEVAVRTQLAYHAQPTVKVRRLDPETGHQCMRAHMCMNVRVRAWQLHRCVRSGGLRDSCGHEERCESHRRVSHREEHGAFQPVKAAPSFVGAPALAARHTRTACPRSTRCARALHPTTLPSAIL